VARLVPTDESHLPDRTIWDHGHNSLVSRPPIRSKLTGIAGLASTRPAHESPCEPM
jgi:hypothetical protein